MNVFKYECRPAYYARHPFRFLRETAYHFKYAWQRAVRGWCDMDCWGLDCYFLNTWPAMIEHLRDHSVSYPGSEPWETPEKWHDYLTELAETFKKADSNNLENPYADAWKHSTGEDKEEELELTRMYVSYEKENNKKAEENLKKGLDMLKDCFFALWD